MNITIIENQCNIFSLWPDERVNNTVIILALMLLSINIFLLSFTAFLHNLTYFIGK